MRKHDTLELLGNCERRILVSKPLSCNSFRRVRTPLPTEPKTIGEHVHTKRVRLGLTQKELGGQLGVWRATLVAWEGNHYQPEGRVRDRVIAWLGFDPRER